MAFDRNARPRTAFGKGGRNPGLDASRERLSLHLSLRLREKIENYERAARRLKTAGEADAAEALHIAAEKLRLITIRA